MIFEDLSCTYMFMCYRSLFSFSTWATKVLFEYWLGGRYLRTTSPHNTSLPVWCHFLGLDQLQSIWEWYISFFTDSTPLHWVTNLSTITLASQSGWLARILSYIAIVFASSWPTKMIQIFCKMNCDTRPSLIQIIFYQNKVACLDQNRTKWVPLVTW